MTKNINFNPLKECLTNEISPSELSEMLDEIIFEHIRMCFALSDQGHEDTQNFIYELKRLRDLFKQMEN